ncbi:hypothetical protein SAMN04487995_2577 [Dyadobacter koreensis]|uniref:Phage integrase, N-terminal SAM-like domain n=1 Tax=Dyadobacter koreensis TaxID=408657 RepID=A0A1H6UJW0_9BACT|nr:hypothetical protein [Dyadobacter koreensis]SEI92529.1 hypothetical protein SAMN04487995_2577 [Dyadobacter koreensis]
MKTNQEIAEEINRLMSLYINEVESSNLKPLTANMYITHTQNFIRWIEGDFNPGERASKKNSKAD